MAPRDVKASRSSQCDWRDSRPPPSLSARIAIPSTLPLSPPNIPLSRYSATPRLNPLHVCAHLSPSFVPSDFTNILHISSFLSYRIFCLYLSHPSRHVPSLLFHPLRSPCLFLPFIPFLPHFPFLLDLPSTPISSSLSHPRFSLLALSRASPSVPQQPSRHWPS